MQGFKSTLANPYSYPQQGVWRKGQYTFQAIVKSDSGYAFAFQRADTTWQTIDLSWQVRAENYCKVQWTFTLEEEATVFKLIANDVTGETLLWQPMLEKGTNGSTPIAHEEDLRGMDGDNHEFIFTRNDTGIAPDAPLSTQDDDYVPEDWTDNAQGVTPEIPFEFVSMRERKNGVWLDFSPPSLWAKWGEDGLSVNLLVEGHYNSKWVGVTKVTEIVGGVDVGGNEVVKVSAVFRKGEENIAATVSQSRGFQWYVNGVHLTAFDNQPFITLDETYGDGFADYVVLSYLVNSTREEERREIINISEGMDGIGEEFIFKANNSDTTPPVLPQTTDAGYQDDDYYGQGTANEWSDDPVAPTELNQFVWVAKRKKIGGLWEAFGTPSVWTKWVEDGEPGAGIESVTDYYAVSTSGTTPPSKWYTTMPSKSANEYLWNYEVITYTDGRTPSETEKRVIQGKDAVGIVSIVNAYGYSTNYTDPPSLWYYLADLPAKQEGDVLWVREDITYTDGTSNATQGYPVRDGEPGKDAVAPIIINGFWAFWDDALQDYVKSSFSAVGDDGHSPYVDELTGTWFEWNGTAYEDTGIIAKGEKGDDGTGILDVVDWYAISTDGVNPPGTGWQTTLPAKPANYYLWNYEVITYTDGRTPTETQKRVIQGKDARSIYDIKNAYAYSSSDTVSPTSGWQYSIAALGAKPDGYFLWVREDIAYTDNPSNYIGTIGYVVRDGEDGKDGSSAMIEHIFYLATSASSGVTIYTSGWKQDPTQTPLTPTNKYLWSYTNYVYTNGGGYYNTIPAIIGVYGDKGADGHSPYINETTGTWWTWNETTGQYEDTGMSPVGSDGRIPYPAGYYDSTKRYRREQDYTPYVQYGEVLYLLIKDTPYAGIPPTNTTYWKAFNQWEAVFVDSLVAKFAKIGGAVFTGDTSQTSSAIKGRLISERGVDNTTNYQTYTGDSGSWQPKLMLDFLNGRAKFEDAEVKGEITASSGSIGNFTIENGKLVVTYSWFTYVGPNYVKVTQKTTFQSSGVLIEASYGGTTDHPEVVSWNAKFNAGGVTVGSMELRRDGLYRNGVFVI